MEEEPEEPGDSATALTANEATTPLDGTTLAESCTLPVSPRLSRVTVEAADRPASMLAGLAPDADRVKSCATITETETIDDWVPLVAETWIEYEPAGVEGVVETVSVDAPEPPRDSVIWLGLKEVVMLGTFDAGFAVRDTAP